MMKHLFLLALAALMVQGCVADKGGREQLPDPSLAEGLALLAPEPVNGVGVRIDTLAFYSDGRQPVWRLCSWTFGTTLSGDRPSRSRYGRTYADEAFSIARSRRGTFTLAVQADKVYAHPRSAGSEPWINFLVETDLDAVRLADAERLTLTYDMRVVAVSDRLGDAFDASIHAAQFLGYLYVRNLNTQSADYMKSLWLGVGMYDNRCPLGMLPEAVTSWDIGTATYIHNPSGAMAFGEGTDLNNHRWHHANVDVKAAVAEAIQALQGKGYLTDSRVEDFAVTGLNFGWELPGTYNVVGQFRGFSLKGYSGR